jgi:hypothetical protein
VGEGWGRKAGWTNDPNNVKSKKKKKKTELSTDFYKKKNQ